MPRKIALIAGLCLLLAACGGFDAPPPKRTPARPMPPAPLSTIALSLTVPGGEIARLLNDKTQAFIADVHDRPVKCGIGRCHLDLRAQRTGPIAVRAEGGALAVHLPFALQAQIAAPGFFSMIRGQVNGAGEADARTAFAIASNWQLRSQTSGTVHVDNSHLRLGPLVTNLADVLNDNEDVISRPLWKLVDKQLARLKLRPQVEKAWAALAKPIRVGKKPLAWLVLQPERARVARPVTRDGALVVSLALDVRGTVVPSDTPPANAIKPLPAPAPLAAPSDRFEAAVPIRLPYDTAARLALQSLTRRPPRIAGTLVTFKSLAILPSHDDVVLEARFCIAPGWDFTGWFSSCATGYLRGAPVFDPVRGKIRVVNVHYDVETADLILRTMRFLAGDALGKALDGHLVFDESKEIEKFHASISKALEKPQGRDVVVSAAIDGFGAPALSWTADGFLVILSARGHVKADLKLERL
ncbi:MAG TPA: DUF4403 family protein [Rhizomicrobium sp.]|jgi:hypothetical protein|nr:DUF4403 family protein [Rhizomicrobium sp.]